MVVTCNVHCGGCHVSEFLEAEISIEAEIAELQHFLTKSENEFLTRNSRITVSNIWVSISSDAPGTFKMWKCRMKRGVREALPPPGGIAAQII